MKHIDFIPTGVCSRRISFDLTDDGKISNLNYVGGCNGNLKAIGILVEGQDAKNVSRMLKGNICGGKKTSCADQLAQAIDKFVK